MLWFPARLAPQNPDVVLFIHSCSVVWLQLPVTAVDLRQPLCSPWSRWLFSTSYESKPFKSAYL